jgi:hypothetical protein
MNLLTRDKWKLLKILTIILLASSGMADDTEYDPCEVTLANIYAQMYGQELKFFDGLRKKLKNDCYPNAKDVPSDRWVFIDMRKVCNMGFEDKEFRDGKGGWTDDGPNYDLHPFMIGGEKEKFGKVNIYGVPFDIIDPESNNDKSIVTMRSGYKPISGKKYPQKVEIPVRQKLTRIYFLHGASWATAKHGWGASRRYELVYADGTKENVLLVVKGGGHGNIDNWMANFRKGARLIESGSSKYVPILTNKGHKQDWRYLYTYEYENPYPEKEIKQINLISDDNMKFTIVAVAITGVKKIEGAE